MKKSMKLIKFLSIVTSITLLTPSTVFAKDISGVTKSTYNNESVLISEAENAKYYVTNDELIKVVVENETPIAMRSAHATGDSEFTNDISSIISFYSTDLNEEERDELLSPETRSGSLTRQDQALTSSGKIRATLSVKYSNSAGGVSGLHLCKATGSYEHLAYESGIVAESSSLNYSAWGQIYTNGSFVKNGNINSTRSYGPSFSNIQLMPEGTCVKDYSSAGVTYTLYCSRGISVSVYMPW